MPESRLVPCNLMNWPRIRDLIQGYKLIVYHLWATCPEASGCFLFDAAPFGASLGLVPATTNEAIEELERRDLVVLDGETGELLILDWYRWHKFDGRRQHLLTLSLSKIRSEKLHKKASSLANQYVNYQEKVKCKTIKEKTHTQKPVNNLRSQLGEPHQPSSSRGNDEPHADALEAMMKQAAEKDSPDAYLAALKKAWRKGDWVPPATSARKNLEASVDPRLTELRGLEEKRDDQMMTLAQIEKHMPCVSDASRAALEPQYNAIRNQVSSTEEQIFALRQNMRLGY